MYECMNVCMHTCMDACMHGCMYVCMYVCICMYVCMYVCEYVCMYGCMHACMYVGMYGMYHTQAFTSFPSISSNAPHLPRFVKAAIPTHLGYPPMRATSAEMARQHSSCIPSLPFGPHWTCTWGDGKMGRWR